MCARLVHWRWFLFAFSMIVCLTMFHVGGRNQASAQELSVAQPVAIEGDVLNGSIVSYDGAVYTLSHGIYDNTMYGVVSTQAVIEVKSQDGAHPGTYPVISTGVTQMRVSTENGAINVGDTVTSSSVPGVAMKATKSGFIVGVAQSSFDSDTEGTIPVVLTIKFAFAKESPAAEKIRVQLQDLLKLSGLSIIDDPITSLRYLLAACVVIASLVVTFLTVGKVARGGVDAMGRNPLAGKAITFSIIMNTVLSIAIVGMGLAAAYLLTAV